MKIKRKTKLKQKTKAQETRKQAEKLVNDAISQAGPATYDFTLIGLGYNPGSYATLNLDFSEEALARWLAWDDAGKGGRPRDADEFFELVPFFVQRVVFVGTEGQLEYDLSTPAGLRGVHLAFQDDTLEALVFMAIEKAIERRDAGMAKVQRRLRERKARRGR